MRWCLKGNGIFYTQSFYREILLLFLSLAKVFGASRFPRGRHSFCGQQHWERFLLWITSKGGVCHWLNGVVYAKAMGKRWITF